MAELEFMPRCHALQHNDVGDMANMQNKSGVFDILELRLRYIEMWVKFSQKDLLQPRQPSLKLKF